MQVIHLKSSASRLRFDIRESGWTSLYLESNEQSIELGAEVNYILFRKLRDFLGAKEIQKEIAGNIENQPVIHVLSLSEKHTSVYASVDNLEPTLFFQSSEGKIFAKMRLASSEINNWLEQLALM